MINLFSHKKISKAAILIGCFFMYACENDVNEVRELGRKRPGIEEGRNINSYLSMNGKMRAHLTAPLLVRNQDSGMMSIFPNTLHVDFYNDSAKVESQLSARYGRYKESERKVYLRDNVVVFNVKGDTLFCEDLYWDQNTQKFNTDRRVVISKNHRRTFLNVSNGMVASQDLSSITLFNPQPGSFVFIPDSTQSSATVPPPKTDTLLKKIKKP